jgi:thiol:disulfide interchange protein DsbA
MRLAETLMIVLGCAPLAEARAAERYVEGSDYYRITPPQTTTVPPGKVEVMEVFSYGCPVCNTFQPTMEGLRRVLPANTQIVLLPAAFNPSEDWPMFQRAYITAQLLGVAERAHQGIFDAVWKAGSCDHQATAPCSRMPPRSMRASPGSSRRPSSPRRTRSRSI